MSQSNQSQNQAQNQALEAGYREQHGGYDMSHLESGATLVGVTELASMRRKSAAFDGMATYSLTLIPSPHIHSDNWSCEDYQHNGVFAPTSLEAAERMIAMCESGNRKSIYPQAKCGKPLAIVPQVIL